MGIRFEQNFCDLIEHEDELFPADNPLPLQVVLVEGFFIFDCLCKSEDLAELANGELMVEDAAVDHEHEGLAELEDIGFDPAEG